MNDQEPLNTQARRDSGTDTTAVVSAIVIFLCERTYVSLKTGRRLWDKQTSARYGIRERVTQTRDFHSENTIT